MSALAARTDPGVILDTQSAAEQIREEVASVGRCLGRALEHAVRVGRLLIDVQATFPVKGGFVRWMEENLDFHFTTAYAYMRVARNADRVGLSGAKNMSEALRLITTGSTEKAKPSSLPGPHGGPRRGIAVTATTIEAAARELCDLLSPFGYPKSVNALVRSHAHRVLTRAAAVSRVR